MKTFTRSERQRLHRRGRELIHTLYKSYQARFGTYMHNNLDTGPQNLFMPGTKLRNNQKNLFEKNRFGIPEKVERGSLTHILWLFFATLTDRRQVSMDVYRAHVEIFSEHPEWYTAEVIKKDPKEFGEELARYKVGVPRQSAEYWVRCAKTLFEEFEGNPLYLLHTTNMSVDNLQVWKDIEERKRGTDPLPGYGPKITSLFYLYLTELGKCKLPEDAFPVDMHVQRLFIQYGAVLVGKNEVNDRLEEVLRPFICKLSKKEGLDMVDLSHAFWQLGRTSCTSCSRKKSVALHCPIEKDCKGPVNSKKYFTHGIWEYPIVFMRKGNSMEFCLPKDSPLFVEA